VSTFAGTGTGQVNGPHTQTRICANVTGFLLKSAAGELLPRELL
jgi:hypothetical protein